MNRTMIITAIVLVAVVMGVSAVVPAMSVPNLVVIPLAKTIPQNACGLLPVGMVCLSIDHDGDNICDTKPFKASKRTDVGASCFVP